MKVKRSLITKSSRFQCVPQIPTINLTPFIMVLCHQHDMFLKTAISFTYARCLFFFYYGEGIDQKEPGLKVNDEVDAYGTTFLPVHLTNQVWSHQQALKAKEQMQLNNLLNC